MQTPNDLTFELVASGDTAKIYVENHGKPLATASAKAVATINFADKKTANIRFSVK